MKPFIAPTENFVKSEKTGITIDASAGSSVSVSVKSNNGIVKDDYCIIGREGEETTEIQKVSSITGKNIIIFTTLNFAHKKDEPITEIRYNQRKFYGCITKTGTFVYISISNIEVDNPKGTYFEYIGDEGYLYFKVTYYNEFTVEESDIDDAIAVRAGAIDHYCSIFDIREEAGFVDNPYVGDGRIHAYRLSAESEVKASLGKIYSLPLSATCELVKVITKLLGAGWLMWAEYGEEASGTDKDGMAKVKEARSMLKAVRNRQLILLDENDNELGKLAIPEGQIQGWPDETTKDAEDDEGGGDVEFRISKKF